jgi:pimeloyl-ACP methyl ester carboxylesterase
MPEQQKSRTGFAEVNGARLAYEVAGQGHPLVLIHAGICDSRMWDVQWQTWPQHFQVIRYDVRGFGRSERPPGTFAHRDDLYALLRTLGVDKTYLVGVSMAGEIALEFIIEHPDMVDGLVLVAAGHEDAQPSDELRQGWQNADAAAAAGNIAEANEIELRLWVDGPRRSPTEVDPAVREQVRVMNGNNFTLVNEAAQDQWLEPSVYTRLGEIRVSTLIITGDLDQTKAVDSADLLQQAIPGSRKVVIGGTAHLPSMEQPEQFEQIVFSFFDALR